MLEKSIKIKIALSVIWGTLTFLFAFMLGSDSYSHAFSTFLISFIILNLPLLIYWLGFWVWGNGFIFSFLRKTPLNLLFSKRHARKILPLIASLIVFCTISTFFGALEDSYKNVFYNSSARTVANIQAISNFIGLILSVWLGFKTFRYLYSKNSNAAVAEQSTQTLENENLLSQSKIKSFFLLDDPLGKHPWRRYWARTGDYLLWAVIIGLSIGIADLDLSKITTNEFVFSMFVIATWIFIETILVAIWGTTPCKWMLGIKIKSNEKEKIDLYISFLRAIKVWMNGVGFGIPFICLLTQLQSRKKLITEGKTVWDIDCKTNIEIMNISLTGKILFFLVLLSIPLMNFYAVQSEEEIKAFENKLSQYPEMRSNLIIDYLLGAQAGLAKVVSPDEFLKENNYIFKSKQKISIVEKSLNNTKEKIFGSFDEAENLILSSNLNSSVKTDTIRIFKSEKEKSILLLSEFLQTEQEIINTYKEIISFIEDNQYEIDVSNGQFLFATEKQLKKFNGLVDKMSSLSTKEQEVIKRLDGGHKNAQK